MIKGSGLLLTTGVLRLQGHKYGLEEKVLTILFTAVAVPIWMEIENEGVKPKPSVTSFSASLGIS